jgi:hypothetical protein
MCTDKSINLLEYPYSLSYQDNFKSRIQSIPALASIIEVLESERNETLLNLQYILKPFMVVSEANFKTAIISA